MGLVIAIDGGGTSCRAALADGDGRIVGVGRKGPANVNTDFDMAVANIAAAADEAIAASRRKDVSVGALPALLGLAGLEVGVDRSALAARLPFVRCHFEDDATIALHGALGESEGVVALFGTGSVYRSRQGETLIKAGGWGFVIGDQASGARLGCSLLERTLLAHDGVIAHSSLTRAVMAEFDGDPRGLVRFARDEKPGAFARYAPWVFEHADKGDAIGGALVEAAVGCIDATLETLAWPGCETLCLMGGLAPFYRDRIAPRFREMLREPIGDALAGAARLAAMTFADDRGRQ